MGREAAVGTSSAIPIASGETAANRARAAAWLGFMSGLLAGGEVEDVASFAIAGAVGAALVVVGFAAARRCRTLSRLAGVQPARLALLSLAIGAGLGVANLAANWAIAASDPAIRALLVERMETLRPRPLIGLVAAPLVEEVVMRLFLMSVIAWVVSRFTKRAMPVFAIALVGSAFVFALLHLDRPLPADPMLADFYRAALVAKYTLAGLPLGWIFWRWGLPYAILCHVAANGAHLALQGHLLTG